MSIEEAKLTLIKETIDEYLPMSDYLRSTNEEYSNFHEGWCHLAYEILGIIGITEVEIRGFENEDSNNQKV